MNTKQISHLRGLAHKLNPVVMIGNNGNNSILGLAGNDTITGNQGNDILDGGTGVDTVNYAGTSTAVQVSLLAGAATGGAGTDTLLNFENITGSSFADTLTGNALANVITGGLGNDTINGGVGSDLHIIFNNYISQLRNFLKTAIRRWCKSKTITSNHCI